ncbi:MAG: hypothetical protein KQH63_03500 [Desulfobulbaceae bacterium]|nr:hypothetical protein [Desulfobulbaceae bacterium]
MNCRKCGDHVAEGSTYEFKGMMLCDDCYIDLMLGTPDITLSKLPQEIQCQFQHVLKGWHRHRPNRHHYLHFPEPKK